MAVDPQEVLNAILDFQPSWSSKNTDAMQRRGRLVRTDAAAIFERWLTGTKWSVEGSDGRGLKARIPWVRIFDERASPRATVGWYLVYLFAADGRALYLTLNQGTTDYLDGELKAKDPDEIAQRTESAHEALVTTISERSDVVTEICLGDPGGLGVGYEAGTVIAFRYSREAMPTGTRLESDLRWMLEQLTIVEHSFASAEHPTYDPSQRDSDKHAPKQEIKTGGQKPMDNVDNFTEEFARAIARQKQWEEAAPVIAKIQRVAQQLADSLIRIEQFSPAPVAVTPGDLERLRGELDASKPQDIADLTSRAHALLEVIDAGIIAGDAARLRCLIESARSLDQPSSKKRGSGQPHLENPVRVYCSTCSRLLVGRREPAYNWNAVTKAIRDHERDTHGAYSTETRDALSRVRQDLRDGKRIVSAARYEIGEIQGRT